MPEDRSLARAMAWTRVGAGALRVIAPAAVVRMTLGGATTGPGSTALSRSVGVRDLGIGIGLLGALERDWEIAPWALFASAADLVDAAGTLVAYRRRVTPRVIAAAGVALAAFSIDFFAAGRIEGRTPPAC